MQYNSKHTALLPIVRGKHCQEAPAVAAFCSRETRRGAATRLLACALRLMGFETLLTSPERRLRMYVWCDGRLDTGVDAAAAAARVHLA